MERAREPSVSGPEGKRPPAPSARTPTKAPEASILALQRSAGNGAVARAILQRAPQPLESWQLCDEIDELVEPWIQPKYKQYIDRVYFASKPGELANLPVLRPLKWWKRFANWGMVDVDVRFVRLKKGVGEHDEVRDDNIELGHVKVTVEAKGSKLTATLHDWYAPFETTWTWSGTLMGDKGFFGGYSGCRIDEAEPPPPPPKPRPPEDAEKDTRREVPA